MRKEPLQRYQSAEEMLRDIKKVNKNPDIIFNYEYPEDEEEPEEEKSEDDAPYARYDEKADKKRSPAFNIILGAVV